MLLEHIKRYDNDKVIKLVSIDDIRTTNANISSKIPSVPALMMMPSKEIFFGKQAFDILLLPPRGILCKGTNSTKADKKILDTSSHSGMLETNIVSGVSGVSGIAKDTSNNGESDNEPFCFSLNGSSKYSDNFSSIEDESAINNDRNYRWNIISEENDDVQGSTINNKQNNIINNNVNNDEPSAKKQGLPSIEELMLQRDKDIM
jgi:hypothetical protein